MRWKSYCLLLLVFIGTLFWYFPSVYAWTEYKKVSYMDLDGDFQDEVIIEAGHGAGTNHYLEDMRIFKDEHHEFKLIFHIWTLDSTFGLEDPANNFDIVSEVRFLEPTIDNGNRSIIVDTKKVFYKDTEKKTISRKDDLGSELYEWNGNSFIKSMK